MSSMERWRLAIAKVVIGTDLMYVDPPCLVWGRFLWRCQNYTLGAII